MNSAFIILDIQNSFQMNNSYDKLSKLIYHK